MRSNEKKSLHTLVWKNCVLNCDERGRKRPSNPGEGLSLPLSLFLKSNRKRLFGEKGWLKLKA